jgi:hypothetical protein
VLLLLLLLLLIEPVAEASVVIRPSLDEAQWACLEPDKIVVRALDVGNVRTISHVLGQSVALDHYNS